MAVAVGQQAPDFTLKSQDNEEITLSSFRGRRNVVLAFYAAAFSRVCTQQFGRIGEKEGRFGHDEAQVIGVSVDSRHSQKAFAERLGLEGTILLADFEPKGAVARSYGVYLDGPGFAGRATFVIDKQGVVQGATITDTPATDIDEDQYFEALAACRVAG